ncbi:alpha/beta fold hydrolase [Paracidovorax sp. MALMAid1276]|uniref:alpha/beta fold hydrolase n=1 Tax=Paracidovorax sp. MALMAid1276 TaxID=3411631 RepID=UPI003B98FE0B
MTSPTHPSGSALQATQSFYGDHPVMRVLRAGLGAAERLWPALAVRAAYRLFGTPLPLRRPGRRAVPAGAWRAERWPFEDAEISVYTPQAQPHGPAVLLLHGWGGHARQMRPLADVLAARGLRPVLVDLPAHGGSRGRVSNLPQFSRAIEYATARLHAQDAAPVAVVAHSLAANAAAHVASRGLTTGRLVLIAPPASPHEYTRLFAQVFGLAERTRAAMQRRIEAREGILMRQFEPPAVGPRIALPTLVVHDRGDRVNRFADGEAFRDHIAGARMFATEGQGHRKILQQPDVLQVVADFAAEGALPVAGAGG